MDMGLDLMHISATLEQSDLDFRRALKLLLKGLDKHRGNNDFTQETRLRRQLIKIQALCQDKYNALIGEPIFSQYSHRMSDAFGLVVVVWDPSM